MGGNWGMWGVMGSNRVAMRGNGWQWGDVGDNGWQWGVGGWMAGHCWGGTMRPLWGWRGALGSVEAVQGTSWGRSRSDGVGATGRAAVRTPHPIRTRTAMTPPGPKPNTVLGFPARFT